jgi:hypothetical protein
MSDVNEFNAQTQEVVVRSYTTSEINAINELKDKDISSYEISIPMELTTQQSADIQTLIDLGISEENAKRIVGVA